MDPVYRSEEQDGEGSQDDGERSWIPQSPKPSGLWLDDYSRHHGQGGVRNPCLPNCGCMVGNPETEIVKRAAIA
jgi:hypothetical protein